jgi:hypothetical protein
MNDFISGYLAGIFIAAVMAAWIWWLQKHDGGCD